MTDPTRNAANPTNRGTLAGVLRVVLGKFLEGMDDMLPATVVAYDRATNRATVRPMIKVLKTGGTLLPRAEIASVPVLNLGGGDFVLTFPINPGDLGWIKANDRDISLFLQNLQSTGPNTLRKHSFSDAVFIPDQFRKWTLNAEDDAAVTLQSLDGTQRVAIHADKVKLTSSTDIILETPTAHVIGNLDVTGDIDATNVTAATEVTAGVIKLTTHPHVGSPTAPSGPISNVGVPLP